MPKSTFDIAMPPRTIPLSVTLSLLFGGWLNQVGWGLVAFGGIFAWIFAGNSELSSLYYFRGEIRTVAGTVTGVEKTGFSTGGGGRRYRSSGRRGKPIYEVRYRYSPTGTPPVRARATSLTRRALPNPRSVRTLSWNIRRTGRTFPASRACVTSRFTRD